MRENHESAKRNYLERMVNSKIQCMIEAKKYGVNYWDGPRKYGYGGYKYIPNRWTKVAKKIIKEFKLDNYSKILDVGCGKAFLLYEIRKILPNINPPMSEHMQIQNIYTVSILIEVFDISSNINIEKNTK